MSARWRTLAAVRRRSADAEFSRSVDLSFLRGPVCRGPLRFGRRRKRAVCGVRAMSVQRDEREGPAAPSSLRAAVYSKGQSLRDGRAFVIRALRPDDRDALIAAIDRTSPQSLYRRFFAPKRYFSEEETSYFLNVDFVDHVALVAEVEENGRPA